jgi:hypothetical protein
VRSPDDFYKILHVQPDAPVELIRTSYRTLMQELKMHPDLGGDTGRATLINEAFTTLRDPVSRAAYDKTLAKSAGAPSAYRQPAPAPAPTRAPAAKPSALQITHGKHMCPFCGELYVARDANRPEAVCWRCHSPLFPALKQARAAGSGRNFDRTPHATAVRITLAGGDSRAFEATTTDISITGARVTSVVDLPIGQHLRLDCGFCIAVGIVRHVRRTPDGPPFHWHIGVEFVTLLIKQTRGAFVSTHV